MGEEQLTQMVMDMRQTLASLTEQMKAAFKRIDDQKQLTESVGELASSVKVMAAEQKRMGEEQTRQRADIDALRMKPAKQWDAVVGQVTGLLIAAAAGGALMKVFGG